MYQSICPRIWLRNKCETNADYRRWANTDGTERPGTKAKGMFLQRVYRCWENRDVVRIRYESEARSSEHSWTLVEFHHKVPVRVIEGFFHCFGYGWARQASTLPGLCLRIHSISLRSGDDFFPVFWLEFLDGPNKKCCALNKNLTTVGPFDYPVAEVIVGEGIRLCSLLPILSHVFTSNP